MGKTEINLKLGNVMNGNELENNQIRSNGNQSHPSNAPVNSVQDFVFYIVAIPRSVEVGNDILEAVFKCRR